MVELAVLSDTHVPSRADRIPDRAIERVRAADHAIHAGDFDSEAAYETVADVAADLTAVRGNTDPASLGLPAVETVELGGVRFVLTHGTGPTSGYRERVLRTAREAVEEPAVSVSGHTHEVMDERVDGIRLLNPGTATGASPADRATMMTVRAEDGRVDVEVHEG